MRIVEAQVTLVCNGLDGSEGPVFDTKGRFYAVAPMESASTEREENTFIDGIAGSLYNIDLENGELKLACCPQVDGYGGRPAGCQSDKNDVIWVADMRLGLLKYSPTDGSCEQISKVDSEGKPLNGANDLVFDDDGNIWFTGPGSPIAPSPEDRKTIFKEPVGRIYCLPKGESTPICVDHNFIFCNGIAVRDKLLLVAETVTHKIIAYDIVGPGRVLNRRVWAEVPNEPISNGPDGMDFDETGQLLVASHGGSHIEVYPPGGSKEPVTRIKFPFAEISNLHFKRNSNVCYVTEHDTNALWRFEWEHKGMPMYCDK